MGRKLKHNRKGAASESLEALRRYILLKAQSQQRVHEYQKSAGSAPSSSKGKQKLSAKGKKKEAGEKELEYLRAHLLSMDRIEVSSNSEFLKLKELINDFDWGGTVVISAHTKQSESRKIVGASKKHKINLFK